MNSELAAMIELQKLMTRFDQLESRALELPKQIEACQAEQQALVQNHEDEVKHRKQLQVDLHEAEVDLKDAEEQLGKKQVRLNEVKTNEEYKATLHEIEALKNRISNAETSIIELMEAVEQAKEDVKVLEEKMNSEKGVLEEKEKRLKAELEKVQSEIDEYQTMIDAKRAEIPPRVVDRFDRIYSRNAGMALAAANDGNCAYCQISLAPHRIQAAKEARELMLCDHCGCILFWDTEEQSKEMAAKQAS